MASTGPTSVLFVVPSGDYLPSGIVRVQQFLPFLDRAGIRHIVVSYYSPRADRFAAFVRAGGVSRLVRPLCLAGVGLTQVLFKWWTRVRVLWLASGVDVVFFQGVLPPIWYIKLLSRLNSRTVLDMDDAIFLGNPGRGAAVVSLMWQVIAGSHFILDYAQRYSSHVALVPSAVAVERYQVNQTSAEGRAFRIGWLGSPSTARYLEQLVIPLQTLAAEGHVIELLVAGATAQTPGVPAFPGVTVTFTPEYRDDEMPTIVARYDVGVMPLDDGPWERAKCAMKALIYMAAGKAVVCSRVGENSYVIEDGVNGLLAETASDWTDALRALIREPQRCHELGRRGRETVEARYSLPVSFALLQQHVFSRAGAAVGPAGTAN